MNLDIVNSRPDQTCAIVQAKLSTLETMSYHHSGMCGLAPLQLRFHFFCHCCLPDTLPVGDDTGQSPEVGQDTHPRSRSTFPPT